MTIGEWIATRLGDVIDIKHGYAFDGDYFRDEPPGDILLTPGNFAIGGGFKDDKLKYYDGPVSEEFVLIEGDLLVTMTDLSKESDTLGFPAFVPASRGARYLHNQRIGKVQIPPDAPIKKRFLYYLLCTRPYRNEVLASATGTTVKHTSPNRIKAFKFPRPTPDEQDAIASILGTLDDKIELNRRMNETLEAMARAIFKSWFVDFDPVRAKAEGRQPFGMAAETSALFPDSFEDSALGKIPKDWRVGDIGDALDAVGGSTPSTEEPTFWDGEINFCTPKHMASLQSPVLLDTERRITEAGLQQISSGLLPKGTVLLSSRAPIGYLAVSEIPVAVNQGIIAMICDKELPNLYVLFWARENMDTIVANANGTTFLEISKRNFRPIKAVVPPPEILSRFMDQVSPYYEQIVNNLQQSRTLSDSRDSLLPKLISGEVRVPVPNGS